MKNRPFFPPEKPTSASWRLRLLVVVIFFAAPILLITLLNTGTINQAGTPVFAYLDLFRHIWNDNPLGASQFLANKSLFAFAHHDPRSGLNLWTIEYDAITLIIYLLVAWLFASIIRRTPQAHILIPALLGAACLLGAATYMTSITHCAGPTWVGFVAYYGLGYENFEHEPYWQILLAVVGGVFLLGARLRRVKSTY